MNQIKTVGVAGATGFVGRAVVGELLARGHSVRALARDPEKAGEVLPTEDERLDVVIGAGTDRGVLDSLVAGADACVNCVGIIREVRGWGGGGAQTFDHIHVQVPTALGEACVRAGANRFVQISALGAKADGETAYLRTKHAGEEAIFASGLDATILRPGLIHGEHGEFIRMAADWARGSRAPWKFMPYFTRQGPGEVRGDFANKTIHPSVQPVAVDDVARAVCECLSRPETIGEIYNLLGSEALTWPEMLSEIHDRAGGTIENLKPWGVESMDAAMVARAAGFVGLGALLPFDEGMAVMGGQDAVGETVKVREHLGIEPAGFRESLGAYVDRI
jgi:uncharacterized protein YbjT (DUF2867 family)